MTADRPATEPRTEAGRKALGVIEAGVNPGWQGLAQYGGSVSRYAADVVSRIEAEAAQGDALRHQHGWGEICDRDCPAWKGAAPRAEGLDVRTLTTAMLITHREGQEIHTWAARILARLSRLSDERQP